MSNNCLNKATVYIYLIFSVTVIYAQTGRHDLSQIKYLYDQLRFEESIHSGWKYLHQKKSLSARELEYIHQYMAYSFYTIGEEDSARAHFLSLLSISPTLTLDPVETSPKIIEFFNQIKKDYQEINHQDNIIAYPEYIFIEDKRPSAAWRSALLPGWGQYYKGQSGRAYILGGTFLASALVLGISIINEDKYHNSYLGSTDPDQITDYYGKYNNWAKVRKITTYSTIGIWLLSFADALWSEYPQINMQVSTDQISAFISLRYTL